MNAAQPWPRAPPALDSLVRPEKVVDHEGKALEPQGKDEARRKLSSCQEKTSTEDRDWRCMNSRWRREKEKHGERKDVGRS